MPERIQRQRTKGWRKPDGAIVVSRPTKWGNPFTVEEHGLELSLSLYEDLVRGLWQPGRLEHLGDQPYVRNYEAALAFRRRMGGHPTETARVELRGRDLACWCPLTDQRGNPFPCHADVLLHLANGAPCV